MVTANTSARIHAAQRLTEAGKLIKSCRSLVCFVEPIHVAHFDEILQRVEFLINDAMKAKGW